jgi:hypothetical protein
MNKELKNRYLSNLFDQMFTEVKQNSLTGNTNKTHFKYLLREYSYVMTKF